MDDVRVRFNLEVDEDGWPPYGSEGMWAVALGNDRFELKNSPWFVPGVANGDVVRASPDSDGVLWATEVLEPSGYLTLWVIPIAAGPLGGSQAKVLELLTRDGVTGEGLGERPIVSIEVAPSADFATLKRELRDGEASGLWHYAEGCVSQAWIDA